MHGCWKGDRSVASANPAPVCGANRAYASRCMLARAIHAQPMPMPQYAARQASVHWTGIVDACDAVPNSGSVAFAPPDADADGLPDSVDPCPARAFSEPAPGWTVDDPRDGCAAPAAPFTAKALKKAVKKAAKAFRAQWRNPRRRAAARDAPPRGP